MESVAGMRIVTAEPVACWVVREQKRTTFLGGGRFCPAKKKKYTHGEARLEGGGWQVLKVGGSLSATSATPLSIRIRNQGTVSLCIHGNTYCGMGLELLFVNILSQQSRQSPHPSSSRPSALACRHRRLVERGTSDMVPLFLHVTLRSPQSCVEQERSFSWAAAISWLSLMKSMYEE